MSHSSLVPSISLTLLALSLAACASQEPPAPGPALAERIEKLAACTPTDLVVLAPWIGPGFDENSGALLAPLPAGHIEAVAQGWRKYDPEATALRADNGKRVLEDALGRPGLIGFESVESEACDISISHTLWRDEQSMLAFVTSTAHATAMANASKMHHAFAGAHWPGPSRSAPPTWKEGLDRFVTELRADLR
jgi:heme-degrading monooxygenase HmoA